ncbi:capsular polysaccharide biosynthesis protein [Virgibacillus pantothenticus]|uniref:Capsular biosynthesis protein n=1 Tax=Virgibacillus pantothenticus TaxID=1473 RepID=A0A0L0QTX2_VIRPA|nr:MULTISPECIES: CapA family protein [Virgibacillus]API91681.1 capsular biosynthesis protein [Virgibacillus sp. 6R]KNE21658.1 capsular biosynthesis protein [Virgibacillus pantothenticus]MBS7427794.1 CapA family protein [Virgibacillus sp. 19R1-5]MBU8568611.1 CapA family protein [Virgibacillus pantothenticus]MBU8602646.1 CapA family protein [Virgibacillus pantothenticus]
MNRHFIAVICIILIGFSMLVGCSNNSTKEPKRHEVRETTVDEKEPPKQEITIAAIGDMLIHSQVYEDAKTETGYNFTPMLKEVKPYLEEATVTVANQETMIGGEELGLSSYPAFNSPFAVGDALKAAGVDVVTIANNHTLDRGEKAIQRAIEHWEQIDMMYTGAYKNEADQATLRVYRTKEGIDVAFLAYTYGTNGIPVPEGKPYLVNLINKERMATEIKKAKQQADVVILNLHFGTEYQMLPNKEQKDLAQFAADQGVHAVIGHHPHVLQPVAWVKGKKGNRTFVAYSLGNFLSGQDELYRRFGGILKFTITKNENEEIKLEKPAFLPTFVKYKNEADYQVIPLKNITNNDLNGAKNYYKEITAHMKKWLPELEIMEP